MISNCFTDLKRRGKSTNSQISIFLNMEHIWIDRKHSECRAPHTRKYNNSKLPMVKLPSTAAVSCNNGYSFYGKLGLMSTRFSLPVRYHIWCLQKYIKREICRPSSGEPRILWRSELNAKAQGTQLIGGQLCWSRLNVVLENGPKGPDWLIDARNPFTQALFSVRTSWPS